MKKLLNTGLALSTLVLSLTACGGKATINPTAPGFNAAVQQQSSFAGQNPYMQPNYAYQPPSQDPMMQAPQGAPGRTAPRPPAGSRTTPTIPVRQASAPRPGTAAPAARPQARPAAQAPRPAAAPTGESVGRELINKTREKFNRLQNFVLTGNAIEKNEKGETRIKLKLAFQKPGQVRLDIVSHNNSMYNGTKLTYLAGGDKVTGRPGGALSFMKMTVPLTDERILTRRGYRLDQVDCNAIVTRLLGNPALNPKILGKTNIGGHEIAVLEFTNVNTFDQRITRELLGIDMQDHFVRIHEMYEGANLVYSLKIDQVTLDGQVSAADFEV